VNFPHRVTFQVPTIAQLPSGQETRTYADSVTLADLPARIVPVVGIAGAAGMSEEVGDAMTLERDLFTVIVKGDIAVERPMRMVSDYLDLALSVIRVQRPTIYASPATHATIVTAERVTAGEEDGQS
jgi:hypothetical protein